MFRSHFFASLLALALALAAAPVQAADCPAPKAMKFTVGRTIRLSRLGFTEGFEVHGADIYESTGSMFGGSRLMRIAPGGKVTTVADFGEKFFGEGLTIVNDQIYQLSWKDHVVFVYDLKGELLRSMRNDDEGWGLTHIPGANTLVYSDGSNRLTFADPKNFATLHTVAVRQGADPLPMINELEWVDGKIYANIFETPDVVRIDPVSGCVEARAQLTDLWGRLTPADRAAIGADANFVLNGIAWDGAHKQFYLTGKQWPVMFAGRFSPP